MPADSSSLARILGRFLEPVSPLLWREVVSAPRRSSTYLSRLQIAGPVIALLLAGAMFASFSGPGGGTSVLAFITFCSMAGAQLSAPFLTGTAFLREQREGTLGLLFMTPLSSRQIVWGKMAGHALVIGSNVLAVAPLLSLCFVLGGLSLPLLLSSLAAIVAAVALSVSTSLWASLTARSAFGGVLRGFWRVQAFLWLGVVYVAYLVTTMHSRKSEARILRFPGASTPPSNGRAELWIPVVGIGIGLAAGGGLDHVGNLPLLLAFPGVGLVWVVFFGGNMWIGLAHLVLIFAACAFFLECAATELDLLRWKGGLTATGAGEKLTELPNEQTLSSVQPSVDDRSPTPAGFAAGSLNPATVSMRTGGSQHDTMGLQSDPTLHRHEMMAKLMRMDPTALAMSFAMIAVFSIRPFFLNGPHLSSNVAHWFVAHFDVARLVLALVYAGTIWHVCRAALKLQRSGVWELIRVSPMENAECLKLTLHQALTQSLLKPLLYTQAAGLILLVLLQMASLNPRGPLEIGIYVWCAVRSLILAKIAGWCSLSAAMKAHSETQAAAGVFWKIFVLPWLGALAVSAILGPWGAASFGFLVDLMLWHHYREQALHRLRRPMEPGSLTTSIQSVPFRASPARG